MGLSMSRVHAGTQTDFTDYSETESDDSSTEEEFFDALNILEDLRTAEVDLLVNVELPDNSTQPRDLRNLLSSTPVARLPPQTDDPNLSSIVEARGADASAGDSGFRTFGGNEDKTMNSLVDDNSEAETDFRLSRRRRLEIKKELSRENKKLKKEREWQREQRALLQRQLKEQEDVTRRLKNDLQATHDTISSLKQQALENTAFITWIEEKLTTVEAENLKWGEKESEMKEQQRQQQTEKAEADSIITHLAHELQEAHGIHTHCYKYFDRVREPPVQKSIFPALPVADAVSTTAQQKSESLQWAEAKITALIEEKSKWEEQKSQFREFKARQETLLQQQEATIRQLEQDRQEKQNTIDTFEGRSKYIKWLEEKLSRLEADNMTRDNNRTKNKAEEQNLMQQQRDGKTLMVQAPRGLRETQGQTEGLAELTRKLKEENSTLRTQNEVAQNELTRLRREVAHLREISDHQNERLDAFEAQRRSAKDKERASAAQQTNCAVQLARARTENEKLRQQLATKDEQIKNLLGQAQRSRHEQQSPCWRTGA